MKIEGNSPNAQIIGATANQQVDRAQTERVGTQSQGGQRIDGDGDLDGDRVDVSPDAQLLGQAVKAAQDSPGIRQDKVDQARQKLAAGQVGNDVNRLANKMIDHLLGS
ncbi:MAG TPA: flagellar biosynthesis anti-sigma factor FlgM [Vicinamibacterales bacterium]|nr:flagellar biosynthesis anti-sigma factor FlgM [Vicinamibacterales bacterium]